MSIVDATNAAGPSEPLVKLSPRLGSLNKRLYYPVGLDGSGAVPAGCLPYICDGGLRFDADPATPGWQEDSAWVGGYYGDKQHVEPAKLQQLAKQLPPGILYVVDVEHFKTSLSGYGDAAVEDAIRKFRAILATIATVRPDVDTAVYGEVPRADYYACANYAAAQRSLAKLQRGEAVSDLEAWQINQVANWDRWGTGKLALNPEAPAAKAWETLQADNDRLAFGRSATGKVDTAGGLVDAVSALCPSCYDHQPGDDSRDYIERSVAEARRLAGGKPVYVFMWATYHPGGGSPRGGQPIDLDEWRTEVAQALVVADGVVLWGTSMEQQPDHVRVAIEELATAQRAGRK